MKKKILKNHKTFKTDEEYYGDKEYVSYSMLKDFNFCEYLFQVKHIDKTFQELREPDYFVYGRAVDTLLTENEEEFGKKFYQATIAIDASKKGELEESLKTLTIELAEKKKLNRGTKGIEDKITTTQEKIKEIEKNGDKTRMTTTVYDHVMTSAKEMKRQKLYQMFEVEKYGRAQEVIALDIQGIKRKGKLDYIYPEKKIIADIKTCAQITKFDPKMYTGQLAYYRELASAKYGIPEEEWDCYIMAVDKHTLYKRSEIFMLSKGLLNNAKENNAIQLKLYYERSNTDFYSPVTAENDFARQEKCMNCAHYQNCEFSLQKNITLIN